MFESEQWTKWKGLKKWKKESVAFSDWFGASYLVERIKLHISARKSDLICAFCTLCVSFKIFWNAGRPTIVIWFQSHCILFFNSIFNVNENRKNETKKEKKNFFQFVRAQSSTDWSCTSSHLANAPGSANKYDYNLRTK